jgi:hypothetical protein
LVRQRLSCSPQQQHISIDGPVIVTPGGQRTTGNYGRHTFDYIIPDGEAGAGDAVSMTQHSEQRITVRRKPAGTTDFSDPVPWRRCNLTS